MASGGNGTKPSSFSASPRQSSSDDDFYDAHSLQSSPNAPYPQHVSIAVAPNRQKFSRYRSVRKANAEAPQTVQDGERSDAPGTHGADQTLKKSLSRYKHTRPMQPPPLAIKSRSATHGTDERVATAQRSSDDPQEAQHTLWDEKRDAITPDPSKDESPKQEVMRSGTMRTTSRHQTAGTSSHAGPGRPLSPACEPSELTRSWTTTPKHRNSKQSKPLLDISSSNHTGGGSPSMSPRSPHSGGSPLPPCSLHSPRSSSDQVRGLVAHAQNADPSISAVIPPSRHGLGIAHASDSLRNATHRSGQREGKPLVDLTPQSAFAKGSLLAGVEQREEQQRREERARIEAWKARRA